MVLNSILRQTENTIEPEGEVLVVTPEETSGNNILPPPYKTAIYLIVVDMFPSGLKCWAE